MSTDCTADMVIVNNSRRWSRGDWSLSRLFCLARRHFDQRTTFEIDNVPSPDTGGRHFSDELSLLVVPMGPVR
jgi:hypothetical protein